MRVNTVESLLGLVTEAIQFKFSSDPSSPGVLVSKLRNGETYVSVVRFMAAFGKDKEVAYKAKESTLLAALENVAKQIVADTTVKRNPVEELRVQLGS